jgi:hypothetical protein
MELCLKAVRQEPAQKQPFYAKNGSETAIASIQLKNVSERRKVSDTLNATLETDCGSRWALSH